jgi:hypothetical protein
VPKDLRSFLTPQMASEDSYGFDFAEGRATRILSERTKIPALTCVSGFGRIDDDFSKVHLDILDLGSRHATLIPNSDVVPIGSVNSQLSLRLERGVSRGQFITEQKYYSRFCMLGNWYQLCTDQPGI